MAKKKISQLTPATALTGSEILPVVQAGTTKSATPTQISELIRTDSLTEVGALVVEANASAASAASAAAVATTAATTATDAAMASHLATIEASEDAAAASATQAAASAADAAGVRTDLAASTGAALVGDQASETGAGEHTQAVRNRWMVTDAEFDVPADGVTLAGTALVKAMNASIARGRPLSLDGSKTYAISSLALPAGLVLETNGATFQDATGTASNSPLITVSEGVRVIGKLTVEIPTGKRRDRVISAAAANIVFDDIDVSSVDQQANTGDNDDAAVRFIGADNVRFGTLRVRGYDRQVQFKGCNNPSGYRFDLSGYTRAVHIEDVVHMRMATGGTIVGASPNAIYTPGHVSVLVSATVDDATHDIVIPNLTAEDAGEHGVRVAGPGRISDVHFPGLATKNCGGSGLKILGTDSGTPTSRNKNITFHGATFEDCGTGGLTANMCGVLAMFCDGVYGDNIVVRKNGKLQSAHTGVRVVACSDVRITGDLADATFDGAWLDGSLGDIDRAEIRGISRGNGRDGFRATTNGTATFRRLNVDLNCDSNTGLGMTIAIGGGTLTESRFRGKLYSNTGGSVACDSTAAVLDITGQVGAVTPLSGITAADGSTWRDTGGLIYHRVASKWRGRGRVEMPANVTNDNAVANTMQDVTGLALAVKAGRTYDFKFVIPYSAAATTTGSRWSINGPAATFLRYRSEYSLGLNSRTVNEGLGGAYDAPAAANTDSAVTVGRNLAIVEGRLVPNVDGTLQARFASEVAGSAITATSHAYLEYDETI